MANKAPEWDRFAEWHDKMFDQPLYDTSSCKVYVRRAVERAIQYVRADLATVPVDDERIRRIKQQVADGYEYAAKGNVAQAAILMLRDLHYLLSLVTDKKK